MSAISPVLKEVSRSVLDQEATTTWVIAAPDQVVLGRIGGRPHYWVRGLGFGVLAMLGFTATGVWGGWGVLLGWLLLPIGAIAGVLWGRTISPLLSRTNRYIRGGRAVRLADSELNREVVELARFGGPLYFEVAKLAAARDQLMQRLQNPEISSAEKAVVQTELTDASIALKISTSKAALGQAMRSLADTEGGIVASGMVNAAVYLGVQQGSASLLAADN